MPAVGPFLAIASASSELVAFGRFENKPNLDGDLPEPALVGLTPRRTPALEPASCAGGDRPWSNNRGEGVTSADDCCRVGEVCFPGIIDLGRELWLGLPATISPVVLDFGKSTDSRRL